MPGAELAVVERAAACGADDRDDCGGGRRVGRAQCGWACPRGDGLDDVATEGGGMR